MLKAVEIFCPCQIEHTRTEKVLTPYEWNLERDGDCPCDERKIKLELSDRENSENNVGVLGEIAAAIAVVMSVIYLGVQIRANTKVLRSQAHFNALSVAQRPFEMVIDNEGLSKILNVGFGTPEKLSSEEWIRCSYYIFMQFNAWEYLYYQNRDESIPKELWIGADKQFIETKPGYSRFWSEWQNVFDEPFRSYVANEFAKKDQKK
jgi:hypothetical protein